MALKQKLAELVVDIKAKLDPLKGHLAKANAMMKRGLASMVKMARRAGKWIAVGLVAALAWATRAAMKQEDAELDLAAALRQTGDATDENIKALKAYAAALQEVTIYGDEEILSQMAYAKNLGVSTDQLGEAAKAAIGLAAKYKLNLATAMMLVGRASQGQTQMLTRYGIVLDDSLSAQGKFSAVLKIGAGAFGLAEDAAKTTTGALKQLWNVIGDIAEAIIAPLLPRLKRVTRAIKNWALANKDLIVAKFGLWLDATGKAVVILARGVEQLLEHWKLLATIAGIVVFGKLANMIFRVVAGLKLMAAATSAYLAMRSAEVVLGTYRAMSKVLGITKDVTAATIKATAATKAYAAASTAAAAAIAAAWAAVVVAVGIAGYMIGGAAIEAWKALEKAYEAEKRLGKAFYAGAKERLAAIRRERDERIKKMRAEGVFARWAEKAEAKRKKAAADKAESDRSAAVTTKDQLEAQRSYYEKIGGYAGKLAAVKKKLRAIEAKEIAEAAELEVGAVGRELEAKAVALEREAEAARKKDRQDEYMEKLRMLKELYTGAKGYETELKKYKGKLRKAEAAELAKQASISLAAAEAILKAKETPAEIAKVGLVGIQAVWGQIATGTERTQEEQLRVLERIATSVEHQEEMVEGKAGLQSVSTPRY